MARAGYCAACEQNVWLTQEGECTNGHSSTFISDPYEVSAVPAVDTTMRRPERSHRGLWISLALVALLVAGCVAAGLFFLVREFATTGSSVAQEFDTRLSADYPGWKRVGFNVQSFTGSGDSRTTYTFNLVAPDRDFPVTVNYVAEDGGEPVLQDEVFVSTGEYHQRADALLDFIEDNYAAKGRAVTGVFTKGNGDVTVNWLKTTGFGPFSWRYGNFDELTYDEVSDSWVTIKDRR